MLYRRSRRWVFSVGRALLVGKYRTAWFPMNEKSVDVSIPILVVLVIVAAWQFYGLAWGGPTPGHSAVEVAASPSATLRATNPPAN